jgi:monovalent cation:H+ antiporter, CPA1 family
MEHGLIGGIWFVSLFLMGLCAIEHYFRGSRLPTICWVLLAGVLYGGVRVRFSLEMLPPFYLAPDIILFLLLPVLIFDSSRKLDLVPARIEAIPSIVLATVGILLTMFLLAYPLWAFSGVPWLDVLLFSAIMSATDPVAVSAIFQQFKVPERLKTLIEGESLLNDGTTVILFLLLRRMVMEGGTLKGGLVLFAISVGVATAVGIVFGVAGAWLTRRWSALHDHFVGPMIPLLFVYMTFSFVQGGLDYSGVIAVMAATLAMKVCVLRWSQQEKPREVDMEFYRGFWDFLAELANAVLFFALGVEIGANYMDISWHVMPKVIIALLMARTVVVYLLCGLISRIGWHLPLSWQHVLNIGGLKGALSVALILMLPEEYAYRQLFLCAALSLSLFTLVINPLILRFYLKKIDLGE